MNYPTCVKMAGTATPNPGPPRKVICFVRYHDQDRYHGIVLDSFRQHYRYSAEAVQLDAPELSRHPHNTVFAILFYRHFQPLFEDFSLDNWSYVSAEQLPSRDPDAADDDFSLWVDPAPDPGPQPEFPRTQL